MNILRKTVSLILAATLLLSLAACGQNPTAQTTTAGQPPQTTTAQQPAETTQAPTQAIIPGPVKVQAADLLENFTPQPVEEKQADEAFIQAGYDFAAKIFQKIYQTEEESKTLLVSPLSILTALAMTAGGAEGNTLKEMEALLGSGSLSLADLNAYLHTYLNSLPSSERAKFSFANGIWFKDMENFVVEDAFLQKNVNYYEAAIRKALFDDSTVQEINQWVDLHTDHMIPKLLDALPETTLMILINALSFDAKWEVPFDRADAIKGSFANLAGGEDQAEYMYGTEYLYMEDENTIGFMKEYQGDSYRFVALLPKDEKGFESWIDGISGESLQALLAGVSREKTYIALPKFSYDYSAGLTKVLHDLGMKDAFSGDKADFQGISKETMLYISNVIHKTHIDLDSDGTRAAAVTAVMVNGATAIEEQPKEVYLTRPFVYMIIDTATQLPIFIGTVTGFEN